MLTRKLLELNLTADFGALLVMLFKKKREAGCLVKVLSIMWGNC